MQSLCDIRVENIEQSKQIERIPIVNTKSGLATPVITKSAQADLVCVAAISIAASKRGNTIAASKTDNTIASLKGVIKTDLV